MRFTKLFKRYVGGGGTALGSDAAPTNPPGNQDNVLTARFSDINGFFGQRIAITMSGPATTDDKTVTLYIWEEQSRKWYVAPTTTKLSQDSVKYFDVPFLIAQPQNRANANEDNTNPGSLEVYIRVSADGTVPNVEYVFTAAVVAN